PIQISSKFQFNPEAKVLLVTNFETTAQEVEDWHVCCNHLGMPIDVWNISSNGHFELLGDEQYSVDRESKIFKLYEGKTIVLLGNSFPYFEARQRMASD